MRPKEMCTVVTIPLGSNHSVPSQSNQIQSNQNNAGIALGNSCLGHGQSIFPEGLNEALSSGLPQMEDATPVVHFDFSCYLLPIASRFAKISIKSKRIIKQKPQPRQSNNRAEFSLKIDLSDCLDLGEVDGHNSPKEFCDRQSLEAIVDISN